MSLKKEAKGPFNNYVDKKRGGGGQLKVHTWSRDKGEVSCKMSTIVHSRGEVVKIGKHFVHVVVE